MYFQFPFQLLLSFIITSTITVIIETKRQIQLDSIRPCPLATHHGVEEKQGSKSAARFAIDFD